MEVVSGETRNESARWSHCSESRRKANAARFVQLMDLALAAPELDYLGVRSLQRRVRRFMEAEVHERDLISWLISYADPTGETAVRNVMRSRA